MTKNVPTERQNMDHLMTLLEDRRDQLRDYLPDGVRVEDFVQSIKLAFIHNPSLHRCTAASKMQALYDCAYAGLDIAGKQPHGYLVPRGTYCCFDLSYHGYIHLGIRSGAILNCRTGTIREGDKVRFWRDENGDHFKHMPQITSEPGKATHYYAVFKLADGSTLVSLMTEKEVEKHRDQFAQTSGSKTPWQTSFEAMAHKTCIKRPFLRSTIQIRDANFRRIMESDQYLDGEVQTPPPIDDSDSPWTPTVEEQEEIRRQEGELFEKHEQTS